LLAVNTHPDTFGARVLSIVRRIPPGRVATYGDVALLAGRPRAWRAVGNIMRRCSRPDVPVPSRDWGRRPNWRVRRP
jgi:alkylated DNA nucleotide flippase Atl1